MKLAEASIKRQLHREEYFRPPYCPNSKCCRHNPNEAKSTDWFRRHGTKKLKRFPYFQFRHQCKSCRRTFSNSRFRWDYRQRIWGKNEEILLLLSLGASKRGTARVIKTTEHLVRIRMRMLARRGLLIHAKLTSAIEIREPIVYDGIENFSFSQFDPNNTNHAVGKNSLFTYDFNFAPLNRKGRMSERQKEKHKMLEKRHGHYPRDAIRTSTKRIFKRLLAKAERRELVLYSDRHYQYRRVVDIDLSKEKIEHITVSSRAYRNFKNPLFPVNNIDLGLRHNNAAFKRETIAFPKHSIAHMEQFVLHALYRNYMRPKFWGTHRSDPRSSVTSPAMEIGIADKILGFKEFFATPVARTQVDLNEDWDQFYNSIDPYSRRVIAPFKSA